MTKFEAVQLMSIGKKLTHRYFDDTEWVMQNNQGDYQFDDGVICPKSLFWLDRSSVAWENDWELFKTTN